MNALQEWCAKWTGKKVPVRTILIVLALLASLLLFTGKKTVDVIVTPVVPEGSLFALKCSSCTHLEVQRLLEFNGLSCPECGAPMGHRQKCRDCSFEYAFMEEKIKELSRTEPNRYKVLEAVMKIKSCPNCSSGNTETMPPESVDKEYWKVK